MEETLVKRSELKELTDNVRQDEDGGSGSVEKNKRAKTGASGSDLGKPGTSFDPNTILLSKRSQLTAKDVGCPICWEILYEPTTLPCKHSLCTVCFLQHAEETSLYCPLCRRRLSIWSRKAKKRNELLDRELWERLKIEFPDQIAARENDDSQDVLLQDEIPSQPSVRDGMISETPGAIFDELKKVIKPHEEDLEKQRREAEEASLQYIKKLQEEEMRKLEIHKKTEVEDFRLAQILQEEYQPKERNEKKSRKSDRVRVPCKLLTDFYCPLGSDLKRKSRPQMKTPVSRKEEDIRMDRSEQKRVAPAAATANDDIHVQESMEAEAEVIDHDCSATSVGVCLLEQQPGPSSEAMETENAESVMPVPFTTLSLLEQTPGSSKAAKAREAGLNDNHDKFKVSVPLTTVDLLEQLPGTSMIEEEGAEIQDHHDQSTTGQPPSMEERQTGIYENENDGQSTVTVFNINADLTEHLRDIMQEMEAEEDSIEVAKPDPKSEQQNETIQCDVPMSSLQSYASKGFDVSGLSSDDEVIPPSDFEDNGDEQLLPSCSNLSLSFDETAVGSDDDDRMSFVIDYDAEVAEAAAWVAYQKTLEQEAEDRAFALTLQREINLGIDGSRFRGKESENKYSLRTWTRTQKT